MRLFLAIDPPNEVKNNLKKQLEVFERKYPDANWVSSEHFHITVHFVGERVEPGNVKNIVQKVRDVLYDQEEFYLYSSSAGLFMQHRLVFFLSFFREKRFESLVEKIKSVLTTADTPIEPQKQSAHLTFGRYRIPSKQQYLLIKKTLERMNVDIEFPVKKIYLFESISGGNNTSYKKIASFPLLKQNHTS